jgi:hypothetical protein
MLSRAMSKTRPIRSVLEASTALLSTVLLAGCEAPDRRKQAEAYASTLETRHPFVDVYKVEPAMKETVRKAISGALERNEPVEKAIDGAIGPYIAQRIKTQDDASIVGMGNIVLGAMRAAQRNGRPLDCMMAGYLPSVAAKYVPREETDMWLSKLIAAEPHKGRRRLTPGITMKPTGSIERDCAKRIAETEATLRLPAAKAADILKRTTPYHPKG